MKLLTKKINQPHTISMKVVELMDIIQEDDIQLERLVGSYNVFFGAGDIIEYDHEKESVTFRRDPDICAYEEMFVKEEL